MINFAYGANFFGEDGVYYLDSPNAKESASVTFLREVFNIDITGGAGAYDVTWDEITGTARYRAYYEIYANNVKDQTVGGMLYASELKQDLKTPSFHIDFLKDLGIEKVDDLSVNGYWIRIYVVTVGDEVATVSFYTVATEERQISAQ